MATTGTPTPTRPLSLVGSVRSAIEGRELDVLGSLPEHEFAEFGQVLPALHDGDEVVPGKVTHLAGEGRASVGEEDLRLTFSAWIEEDVPTGGMDGVVLEGDTRLQITQRNPDRLTTPADVYHLAFEGQLCREPCTSLGRVLGLKHTLEREWARGNTESLHGRYVTRGRAGVGVPDCVTWTAWIPS